MAVADPVPPMDLTPYGCGCCGPGCACVTCPDACPNSLCAIFEADGWTSALGDKVVSRINLPFDASVALIEPGSSGGYTNAGLTSANPRVTVYCFPWGFRVVVTYGQQRGFPFRQWAAVYSLDVTVESCSTDTWPRDLTVPLVDAFLDTADDSSPPSSVRIILSDPNVAAHPDHYNCCYYTESDFLCSRAITDVPAALQVDLTVHLAEGDPRVFDIFPSHSVVCPLVGTVGPSRYCYIAYYQSAPAVSYSCTYEGVTYELCSRINVQVTSQYYPHRYYGGGFGTPPPGTGFVQVWAEWFVRTSGTSTGGPGVWVSGSGVVGGYYRAGCENWNGSIMVGGSPGVITSDMWVIQWCSLSEDPLHAGECNSPEAPCTVITVGFVTGYVITEL